jgi:Glycosyl transferases group 1
VIRLQEPRCTAEHIREQALAADMFVWVHTHGWQTPGITEALTDIRAAGVPVVAYHLDLYLGLRRWAEYESDPYMRLVDHWFTVDRLMADWLNANTTVRGHYLPAAVFGPECYLAPADHPAGNDVIFVGSRGYHPEWPYRPQLIDWLRTTYGPRFTHVGGDGDTGTIRGDELNRLYANSKVVVGDTLCLGFRYPDYWSDRVYETLGRGGMLIHPHVPGMERTFTDGEHLAFYPYGDFAALKALIDHYLDHDAERERIRRAGHDLVRLGHTYTHRWQTIVDTVFGC